ncbi:MAG: hypothetical protein QXL27_09665 [Candidatus Bathyarchaeia archaeon]
MGTAVSWSSSTMAKANGLAGTIIVHLKDPLSIPRLKHVSILRGI